MSLSGSLGEFSALETLQLIGLQKKTGVLEVVSGRRRRELRFAEGRLTAIGPRRPRDPDLMLEALVGLGWCDSSAARVFRSSGRRAADPGALTGICSVDEEPLAWLRAAILQGSIDDVLLWDHGRFRFTPLETAEGDGPAINLEELLLESMRRLDEVAALKTTGFPPDGIPHPTATAKVVAVETLAEPALHVAPAFLRRCDGRRNLRRLVHTLALPEYEVVATAQILQERSLLMIATRGRRESGADAGVELTRRLPSPSAPLWAAGIVGAALLSGMGIHALTTRWTGPASTAPLESRSAFENDWALQQALELHRMRAGGYPRNLQGLVDAGLWPANRAGALESFTYALAPDGRSYTLTRLESSERIHDAADVKSSQTASGI